MFPLYWSKYSSIFSLVFVMDIFRKPDPKEMMRKNERELRKTERDLGKDRRDLDRQEKALEMEIRKAAKSGNRDVCATLAKQLVNLRKQKTRSFAMTAKVSSVNSQAKIMNSNAKMAGAMGSTAKTMATVNKQMDPQKLAKTMEDFSKANMQMEMGDEMISDTLDSILDDSGDEAESDAIVSKVLDEIGIEMSGKLAGAGAVPKDSLADTSSKKGISDSDLEKMLAGLKD